jgi:hypothetical protein
VTLAASRVPKIYEENRETPPKSQREGADSLLASINPEINVIQQIYKVILNRHEILQNQK